MKPAGQFLLDDPPGEPARGVASWYTPGLSDGLGDRLLMFDNTTASSLELLRFKPEFSRQPAFEDALRQRVELVRGLTHPSLAAVRAVEWLEQGEGLALVSNQVTGRRLSEILHEARGPGRAMELIRQMTPVLAAIHEQGAGVSHGVLTADRIIVTPDGRLVLVEHVLGSALQALALPADRLRAEFGLAIDIDTDIDEAGGPSPFDPQADLVQLALIALSLLQGRQIDPFDYPDRCAIWLERASLGASGAPAPPALCEWLEYALHIDGHAFASAAEAHEALLDLPEDDDMQPASRPSLRRTLHALPRPRTPELSAAETGLSTERVEPGPSAADLKRIRLFRWAAAIFVVAAGVEAIVIGRLLMKSGAPGATSTVAAASVTIDTEQPGVQVLVDGKRPGPGPLKLDASGPHSIRVLAPAAPQAAAAATTGNVEITSEPAGARVILDGTRRGFTPLTLSVPAGAHTVVVGDGAAAAAQTINVAGGGQISVVASLAPAGPVAGWLSVTSPLELQVLEGGAVVGTTSAPRIMLVSGHHDLELSNAAVGFKTTISTDIQPGKLASASVTVPNGSLSVNALPWANVWIDGKPAGTTPIANLEVPLGPHEIILRHPQLGERKQTVLVTAKAPLRVVTDLKK